ncbi:expressed unknown protein [Seminavis robusta]|uniref:Uncharacterized protein n=1 Tax=Seminavis robusta TaxID=568900 RepID=A0A9N8HBA9_9STRA|nr:expressed unknown protein [Seminavis robusta]|eukprot:Sro254_g100180.1 n/a (260) ;mRNA; f:42741-43520
MNSLVTVTPSSIVRRNNDAVVSFQGGKYQDSLALFQEALGNVRAKLAVADHQAAADTRRPKDTVLLIQGVPLDESIRSSARIQVDNSSGMTFFDRCFLIANPLTTADNDTTSASASASSEAHINSLLDDNECKVCSVLLYNIGATHHLAGLATGSQQELDKAFKVYQMALEFLQIEYENQQQEQMDNVLLILSMAIMNNIAHIQSTWFQYPQARHCTQWLREAAEHMDTALLRDPDFMFFFLRYYVLPFNDVSSCSAAA